MNTIGMEKGKNSKIDMSLDEIIAREPLRYTSPEDKTTLKVQRPKIYGRVKHEPYQQGGVRRRQRPRDDGWSHYTRTEVSAPLRQSNKECPYTFKYNGVFVTENSPLLNRRIGEVEAIRKHPEEDEDEDDEDGEEIVEEIFEDEDAVETARPKPAIHNHKGQTMPQRRFKDMTYVRLPVHERLGYNQNFLKKRLRVATKFLRQRPNQLKWKPTERQGVRIKHQSYLNYRRLNLSKFQQQSNGQLLGNKKGNEFTVSFKNELATGSTLNQSLMQPTMLQGNSDGVFVAPLSRQNVEQLAGRFTTTGALSQISSVSKSNEDLLHERLTKVENMLFQSQMAASSSVINGYMPLSQQLAQSDGSNISLVNGIPMAKVSSLPMVNSAMTLVNGMPVQQPVTMMTMGGEVQSFMPLVTGGASTSAQFVTTQQPCTQGRVVLPQQGGGFIIQSVPPVQNPAPTARIGRQLIIAANRQPLDVQIQNSISASQAAVRISNFNRMPRESFTYKATPHVTSSSISNRFTNLLS